MNQNGLILTMLGPSHKKCRIGSYIFYVEDPGCQNSSFGGCHWWIAVQKQKYSAIMFTAYFGHDAVHIKHHMDIKYDFHWTRSLGKWKENIDF